MESWWIDVENGYLMAHNGSLVGLDEKWRCWYYYDGDQV